MVLNIFFMIFLANQKLANNKKNLILNGVEIEILCARFRFFFKNAPNRSTFEPGICVTRQQHLLFQLFRIFYIPYITKDIGDQALPNTLRRKVIEHIEN